MKIRKKKTQVRKRRTVWGYTLLEMLLVLGLLSVLSSLVAVNAFSMIRSARQVSMDTMAENMYMAVSRNLINLRSAGLTDILRDGHQDGEALQYKSGDTAFVDIAQILTADSEARYRRYYIMNDDDSLAKRFLLSDSAEDSGDSGNSGGGEPSATPLSATRVTSSVGAERWVVYYTVGESAGSNFASVLEVWYSAYEDAETAAILAQLATDEETRARLRVQENRKEETDGKIGYFGSDSSAMPAPTALPNISLTGVFQCWTELLNAEELRADIYCYVPVSFFQNNNEFSVDYKLTVSGADGTVKPIQGENQRLLRYGEGSGLTGSPVKTGYGEFGMPEGCYYLLKSITLDSLNASFGKTGSEFSSFKAGENINLSLQVWKSGDDTEANQAQPLPANNDNTMGGTLLGVSSLFAQGSDPAAGRIRVAYGRHLQNLNNIAPSLSGPFRVEQTQDIYFNGLNNTGSYSGLDSETWGLDEQQWTKTYPGRNFQPVNNENISSYDGNGFLIEDLHVNGSAEAGLFGTFHGSEIKGVQLLDPIITTTGSAAGGLAGKADASALTVTNCGLMMKYAAFPATPENAHWMEADDCAGGLIGDASGDLTIRNSFAATAPKAGNYAGGLAGSVRESLSVSGSYADCYLSAAHVGGLAGQAGSESVFSKSAALGFLITDTAGRVLSYANAVTDAAGRVPSYANAVTKAAGLVPDAVHAVTDCYTLFNFDTLAKLSTGAETYGLTESAEGQERAWYVYGAGATANKQPLEVIQGIIDNDAFSLTGFSSVTANPYNLDGGSRTTSEKVLLPTGRTHFGDWQESCWGILYRNAEGEYRLAFGAGLTTPPGWEVAERYTAEEFANTNFNKDNPPPWHDDAGAPIADKIVQVEFDDTFKHINKVTNNGLTSTAYWFYGMSNPELTEIENLAALDTTQVNNMAGMFRDCAGLSKLDLSHMTTDKVTNMEWMFGGCKNLGSLAADADDDAKKAAANALNVSGFNTSLVTNMGHMFDGCESVPYLNVSGFDTSNVRNMVGMFKDCKKLGSGDPNHPDAPSYTVNVSNFKTGRVPDMSSMFEGCESLRTLDLTAFDTSNVTNMNSMFKNCSNLGVDSDESDETRVGNAEVALNVTKFDTRKVTDMASMFEGCAKLKQLRLDSFQTSKVQTMNRMFYDCEDLHRIYVLSVNGKNNFDTSALVLTNPTFGGADMFTNCKTLEGGQGTLHETVLNTPTYASGADSYHYAKLDEGFLDEAGHPISPNPGYFDRYSKIYVMFNPATKQLSFNNYTIPSLSATTWELDLQSQFASADKVFWKEYRDQVTSVSFGIDVEAVHTDYWFYGFDKLETIRLDNLLTNKLDSTTGMFEGCEKLQTIYTPNDYSMTHVLPDKSKDMFEGCTVLTGSDGTKWIDAQVTDSGYARVDHVDGLPPASAKPGYFSSKIYWDFKDGVLTFSSVKPTDGRPHGVLDEKAQYPGKDGKDTDAKSRIPWHSYLDEIKTVRFTTRVRPVDTRYWFADCSKLASFEGVHEYLDLSLDKSMDYMFYNVKGPLNLDFSGMDASSCTSMKQMFAYVTGAASVNLSGMNAMSCVSMEQMFAYSTGIQSISLRDMDASSCASMEKMFKMFDNGTTEKSSLTSLDVTGLKMEKVETLWETFYGCIALTEIVGSETMDVSSVTRLEDTFSRMRSAKSLNLSGWNTGNVTNMKSTFRNCSALESVDVTGWNTRKVTTMQQMFDTCGQLKSVDLSTWETPLVTNMSTMFGSCGSITEINLTGFQTSSVTTMQNTFLNCSQLPQLDLSSFDTRKVTNLSGTFSGCKKLRTIAGIDQFRTDKLTTMESAFLNCCALEELDLTKAYVDGNGQTAYYWNSPNLTNLKRAFEHCCSLLSLDLSKFDTRKVSTLENTFAYCQKLTELNLTGVQTGSVTTMANTFWDCRSLETLDISSFRTPNVTTLQGMFGQCRKLREIVGIEDFDTTKVTTMWSTFKECEHLTELDLHRHTNAEGADCWSNVNLQNMQEAFWHCLRLTKLILDDWDTGNLTSMWKSFQGCCRLPKLDLSTWNTVHVTTMEDTFREDFGLEDLNLGGWDTSSVTTMKNMFRQCISLPSLDLRSFDTYSKVTDMTEMFCMDRDTKDTNAIKDGWSDANRSWNDANFIEEGETAATHPLKFYRIYALDKQFTDTQKKIYTFVTDNVTSSGNMFKGCLNLVGDANNTSPYDAAGNQIRELDKTWAQLDMPGKEQLGYFSYVTFAALDKDGVLTLTARKPDDDDPKIDQVWPFNVATAYDNADSSKQLPWYRDNRAEDVKKVVIDTTLMPKTSDGTGSAACWFQGMKNLTTVEHLDRVDWRYVTDLSHMFDGCEKLTDFTPNDIDISNAERLEGMFRNCASLEALNLLSWTDVEHVKNIDGMFNGCEKLETILWPVDLRDRGGNGTVFADDAALIGGMETAYNPLHTGIEYAHADGGESDPGYFKNVLHVYFDDEREYGEYRTLYFTTKEPPEKFKTEAYKNRYWEISSLTYTAEWQVGWKSFRNQIEHVNYLDLVSPISTAFWFYGCSNLAAIWNPKNLNTGSVMSMESMFYGCSGLSSIDVSYFRTGSVINMKEMFANCNNDRLTKLLLSAFDTSSVQTMQGMFRGSKYLQQLDLTSFDTGAVEDMSYMFDGCSGLYALPPNADAGYMNLSGWDVSAVKTMERMFANCSGGNFKYLDLSAWKTDALLNMGELFRECSNLRYLDMRGWDTSHVTNMYATFFKCNCMSLSFNNGGQTYDLNLNESLKTWNTASVTDMGEMFSNLDHDAGKMFTVDVSAFDMGNVTNAKWMFRQSGYIQEVILKDIPKTDPARTAGCNVEEMFSDLGGLTNVAWTGFDFAGLSQTTNMFSNCPKLERVKFSADGFKAPNLTSTKRMFYSKDYTSALASVDFGSTFSAPNLASMQEMFAYCKALTSVNFGDTVNVPALSDMSHAFLNCETLEKIDLSSIDTQSVTNMEGLFKNCVRLNSVNLDKWNTANCKNYKEMFANCVALTELDLRGFSAPSDGTDIGGMFANCIGLATIYATDSFGNDNLIGEPPFIGCSVLKGGAETACNANENISVDYARVDQGAGGVQGLFTNNLFVWLKDNILIFDRQRPDGAVDEDAVSFNETDLYEAENQLPWSAWRHLIRGVSFNVAVRPVSMAHWFSNCQYLDDPNFTKLDTSGLTNVAHMFDDCSGLTTLDLSMFDTAKVTDMTGMFRNCTSLKTIYVSDRFVTDSVTNDANGANGADMFFNCGALVGGAGTVYNTEHVSLEYARIDAEEYGYLTEKIWVSVQEGELRFTPAATAGEWILETRGYADGVTPWSARAEEITSASFADGLSVYPGSVAGWFQGLSNLQSVNRLNELNTIRVTDMSGMFSGCTALQALDVSGFRTERVTTMSNLFSGCEALAALDLTAFNTAAVTDMSGMFQDCKALTELDLTGFDTALVTKMSNMFLNCENLHTIYADESFVTSAAYGGDMFLNCLQLVGGSGTAYPVEGDHSSDSTYARVDGAERGYLTRRYYFQIAEEGAQEGEEIAPTLTITDAPTEGDDGTLDLRGYDSADSLPWHDAAETITQVRFALTGDEQMYPASMAHWFEGFKELTTIENLAAVNTTRTVNLSGLFSGCEKLAAPDLSAFNTASVTDMSGMFRDCKSLETLTLTGLDVSSVVNMSELFAGCEKLTTLDLSAFNAAPVTTASVEDMSGMFRNCVALESLNLAGLDVSSVTNMEEMFKGCAALTELDVSSFRTENVTNMSGMFDGCAALKTIRSVMAAFNRDAVTESDNMFRDCDSLVGGNGTSVVNNPDKLNCEYAQVDTSERRGYFTNKVA